MRDFLKRSVVEFQWIELSTEEDYPASIRTRELRLGAHPSFAG
jgi:hypothetical protein